MNLKLKILTALAVLSFILGVGFICFAPVSNCVGSVKANEAADKLDEVKENKKNSVKIGDKKITSVKELGDNEELISEYKASKTTLRKDISRLKRDSKAYNKKLETTQGTKTMIGYEKSALKLESYGIYDGVFCYISAPTIGLRLPVYLGSSDSKMSYGAAHMYGTSLPIGGQNTNAAIAGHTGYIGRIFFDNIRLLKKGDKVNVTTYWNKLTYEVTGTAVIKPDDVSNLVLEDGRERLELLTCIKNKDGDFDRFVVFCERKPK